MGTLQVLITAHKDSLLKINKIKNLDNLEKLRTLYNNIKNCVRNLKSLKVETSTYGCLLVPLLRERLPEELNIIISRKFSGEVWTLDLLLKYFNEELKAKEMCAPLKNHSDKDCKHKSGGFTTSSFYSQGSDARNKNNKNRCVFCLDENHPPSQCINVTNVKARMDILIRFSKCFICLKPGHIAKNCTSNYVCRKCNGKHNISICKKGDIKKEHSNSIVAHADTSRGILLQTARAQIFSTESNEHLTTRLLFDTGSQQTYINVKLQNLSNLKTIRKEKIVIKTFAKLLIFRQKFSMLCS